MSGSVSDVAHSVTDFISDPVAAVAGGTNTVTAVSAVAAATPVLQYQAAKDQSAAIRHGNEAAQAARERSAVALQRRNDLMAMRQARSAIRSARIARAAVVNTGANSGTLGSSGVQGGASSILTQGGANLEFLGTSVDLGRQITAAEIEQSRAISDMNVEVANLKADAALYGAIGEIGGTIFAAAGGPKAAFTALKTA